MALDPVSAVIGLGSRLIDRFLPDPAQKAAAQIALLEMAQKGELTEFAGKVEIIKTEAASEHWLAANWRPILMLTFGGLIVARWFGWAAPNLSEAEYLKLWDIVQFGISGYVIGRSAEKIVPTIADALKR
jgi:Holin of 3TMs, for gene-transfer release